MGKKAVYELNEHELVQQWHKQMKFLKNEIKFFDEGDSDYAVKIATTLRILFHDTRSSISLAKSIEIKEQLYFWSSGDCYNPQNLLTTWSLVTLKISNEGSEYMPVGEACSEGEFPIYLSFEDWWNEIIFADSHGIFTRKDVVCFLANKDGGAHVDAELDELAFITKMNSLGWVSLDGKKPKNNPLYFSVRQIAIEVMKAVELFGNYKTVKTISSGKSKVVIKKIGEKHNKYFYAFTHDCSGKETYVPNVAGEIVVKKKWFLKEYKNKNNEGKIKKIIVIK